MTLHVTVAERNAAGGYEKWLKKAAQSNDCRTLAEYARKSSVFLSANQTPDVIRLELPFPPSVNHYWRHVVLPIGNGRKGHRVQTLISATGRKYKIAVLKSVIAQRAEYGIQNPVCVHVVFYPPNRCRRDVDNYAKALLDGIVGAGVLADDSLIRDLRLVWGDVAPGGKAVVTIRPMPATGQGRLL